MKAIHTGFGVNWLRATGMLYPEEKRIYYDPFSEKLVTGLYRVFLLLMHNPKIFNALMRAIEKSTPGAMGSHFCRYRYIDDLLTASIANKEIETVVNLGAGMDVRAYFIPGVENIRYFELDHPYVIKKKIKKIRKALGDLPGHVVYVPIDFEQQNLTTELEKAGYDLSSKTLFICEGVTAYLREKTVDSILSYVASSAPGNKIVFSYVIKSLVQGKNIHKGIQTVYNRLVKKSIIIFGIDPDEITGYLSKHSLSLIEDIGPDEYKERYMIPSGLGLDVNEIERTALARVEK